MFGAFDEQLWVGEDFADQRVAVARAPGEFSLTVNHRVDFTSQGRLRGVQCFDCFGESQIAHQHEVNVAGGGFFASGDRAEHQCECEAVVEGLQCAGERDG